MRVGNHLYILLLISLALVQSCVPREDSYDSVRVFYLPVEISTMNNMECERMMALKDFLSDTILSDKNFIDNLKNQIESTNAYDENDLSEIRLKVYLKKKSLFDPLCVGTNFDAYLNGSYLGNNEKLFDLLFQLFVVNKPSNSE